MPYSVFIVMGFLDTTVCVFLGHELEDVPVPKMEKPVCRAKNGQFLPLGVNILPAKHGRDSSPSESIETCFRKTPPNTGNSQDYLKKLKINHGPVFLLITFW